MMCRSGASLPLIRHKVIMPTIGSTAVVIRVMRDLRQNHPHLADVGRMGGSLGNMLTSPANMDGKWAALGLVLEANTKTTEYIYLNKCPAALSGEPSLQLECIENQENIPLDRLRGTRMIRAHSMTDGFTRVIVLHRCSESC
ncbi:hypothetical protein VTN77DRAFT_7643 [Rasamsonia byssochlamydoides]|uniref:uncharacterized protein n=1 Tax=Rasamsonia byssochlamydoides TaxID=89139 RepID=UPI0037426DF6